MIFSVLWNHNIILGFLCFVSVRVSCSRCEYCFLYIFTVPESITFSRVLMFAVSAYSIKIGTFFSLWYIFLTTASSLHRYLAFIIANRQAFIWVFRFPWRYIWGLYSSGIRCYVFGWLVPHGSIQRSGLEMFGHQSPRDAAPYPRRTEIPSIYTFEELRVSASTMFRKIFWPNNEALSIDLDT